MVNTIKVCGQILVFFVSVLSILANSSASSFLEEEKGDFESSIKVNYLSG